MLIMLIKPSLAKKMLASFPGWEINPKEIKKTFRFPSFLTAISFVNRISVEAEKANHHPDIDIRYNKVQITLSTHSEGGITEKDIELAKKIEKEFY